MENASKAIIIAGAILISILLISVGILVMNSTGGMQEQVEQQMDAQAIQSFNAQFSAYAKNNLSASQVKSLIGIVQTSNANNSHKIELIVNNATLYNSEGTKAGDYGSTITNLSTTTKYQAVMEVNDKGVTSKITITEK